MMVLLKAMLLSSVTLFSSGCARANIGGVDTLNLTKEYGVFLSLSGEEAIDAAEDYEIVVIDAQYVSEQDISEMKRRGQQVYSYINLGSLETFRSYFEEFEYLVLKPYVNWENEFWIDASDEDWQQFISVDLATQYIEKGIDGFWVDNVDVYGQFPTGEMYQGVGQSLNTLMDYEKPVILNGGDQFVQLYLEQNSHVDDILTGVNQETVFSAIDFTTRTLGIQSKMTTDYYLDYLDTMEQESKDIYLLEYTTDSELSAEIHAYTEEKDWTYFISDSIELDGN